MDGVLAHGRPWLAGAALCVAAGCQAPDRSAWGPLSADAAAGCFQFAYADGRPLGPPRGPPSDFWAAPVRLDTALALLDGDGGYRTEPGTFAVVPTGPVHPADTSLFRSTWQVLPPDTLFVGRGIGFAGQVLRLRAQGTDFAGVETWGGHVVDTTRPPREDSVVARRVPCPAPAG